MLPAHVAEIRPIFDGRVAAARSVWEKYEEEKAKLREQNLSGAAYELAAAFSQRLWAYEHPPLLDRP